MIYWIRIKDNFFLNVYIFNNNSTVAERAQHDVNEENTLNKKTPAILRKNLYDNT